MIIKVRRGKFNTEIPLEVEQEPELLKEPLLDIAQDDESVGNLIMEKSSYKKYGCRVVALHRCVNYLLKPQIKRDLTVKETDDILDAGGESKDAWMDGGNYDIVMPEEYVKRINEKFGVSFKYLKLNLKELGPDGLTMTLHDLISKDTPGVAKMPGLFGGDHFVNVDGLINSVTGVYLRMNETYRRYDGYGNKWCLFSDPKYYEFIVRS